MWHIILFSMCLASPSFILANEPPVSAVSQASSHVHALQYSPSVNAPLSYSPPSPNYPSRNFENGFEVSLKQNEINNQFARPQISSDGCPQLKTLESILVLLKRILNQDSNKYVVQPDKRMQILQHLKELLEISGSRFSETENHQKLTELINRVEKSSLLDSSDSVKTITDNTHKNHVEANFIFKYDIPNVNSVGCKEALAILIQTVKNAHLQMINYCKQSGRCNLNFETNSSHMQHGDNSNILNSIFNSDQPTPAGAKISSLNNNLLNSYDVQKSVNSLVDTNSKVSTQEGLNAYLNYNTRPQVDLNGNQYVTTNNFHSGHVQSLNNQEKNLETFNNLYLNKETIQTNKQLNGQSNVVSSLLSIDQSVPKQVQEAPPQRDLLNIYDTQSPLTNLGGMSPTQADLSQSGSNGYFNLHQNQQPYLTPNRLSVTNLLNAGTVETENKKRENIDVINKKYVNILESNNLNNILNTPPTGNKYLEASNPPPFLQNPYDYQAGQPLFKFPQILDDKRISMAFNSRNKQDINERSQYDAASIANHQYYTPNQWAYINPNEIRTFATPSLMLTNTGVNLDKFRNQNLGMTSPSFEFRADIRNSPYLNSLNVNQQNRLNYNSKRADATTQSNFGLNLFAPTNLADYPKQDIYGNTLFDSHRLGAASNLVKLNSGADNEGVVELTYKLRRPQPIANDPYYYVKYRVPYRDFASKITGLTNQNVRSDPLKLHQELLSVSNLTEASPGLKNVEADEVSKLILNNGATLVNAKVYGTANDTKANEYLKRIQYLNANLNTNEILSLVDNYNANDRPVSLGSVNPAPILTFNPQYIFDIEQRRFVPRVQMPLTGVPKDIKPLQMTFLPTTSQILLNPEVPQRIYTSLNDDAKFY